MCGIVGIYGLEDENLIKKMTRRLTHRGPDDEGYYLDKDISLGMRRLSIIDLKTGKQPIFNEQGNLIIIFNGEIYNYRELREELEQKGHPFKTKSDTEVILHAYEEYGKGSLNRLEGMFVFAIWDLSQKELFIARDKFGIKPLFYTFVGNQLVFGSEVKALFQYDRISREIDRDSLYEKFLFGHCILESTLFKGINQLLPGHYLTISKDKFEVNQYWSYRLKPTQMSEKEAISKLTQLLEQGVKRRLVSDVGFGVFLSGGVDSSLITAIAHQVSEQPVKTFTVGGPQDVDFRHARIVADQLGTKHHEIDFHEDLLKITSDYVFAQEDTEPHTTGPIALAQGTKKYSKMVLCGQAADETFGGYPKYKQIAQQLNMVLNKWKSFQQIPRDQQRARKLFNYLHNYVIKLSQSDNFNNMLYYDMGSKLTNLQLAPVDRTSMAHGLEVRVPYLDSDFINFVCSIPPSLKLKQNLEKYILRQLSPKFELPKTIQDRGKYMSTMGKSPDVNKIPLVKPRNLVTDQSVTQKKEDSGDYARLLASINPKQHRYGKFFPEFPKQRLLFMDLIEHFFIKHQAEIPKNFSINDLY